MTSLPEPFQRYSQEINTLTVGDIEFSGGTYQVQVIDSGKEEFWAFLQFGEKNRLKDSFCSCESEDEKGGCCHLAAAYERIFQHSEIPLHSRYKNSLWNHLCQYFAEEYGYDPKIIIQKGNTFSLSEEEVFIANGLSKRGTEKLKEIFYERPEQTEETSLKFSDLSEEEIRLWKQGRPSSELKYELSFWNDLAKHLMLLQDSGQEYSISYSFTSNEIPNGMEVTFKEISLGFALTQKCLSYIISSLSTVNSPLKVYGKLEDRVEKILYHRKEGEIEIVCHTELPEEERVQSEKSFIVGDWVYIPKQGFFPRKTHPLLEEPQYRGEEIAYLLDRYYPLFQAKLEGVSIREKPVEVSYLLFFDQKWALHIKMVLFNEGDFDEPHSRLFGDWAYLESEGFVHLDRVVFKEKETIIQEVHVGDFIQEHRNWLNQREGFRTHITGVETRLTYTMTEDNSLLFNRLAIFEDETALTKDFGKWFYIQGQGFFSKVSANIGIPIRSGVTIKSDQIPLFIRMYVDELALVPGFFSERCPLSKSGLRVELTPQSRVLINPEYVLNSAYSQIEVKFFEDYTYVEGEGFYRIPQQMLLPERYRYTIELDKSNLPQFFRYELEQLKAHALWIDPRLIPSEKLTLVADSLSIGKEGYSLHLRYHSGKGDVAFLNLWEAHQNKERFVFSEAGLIDLEDGRFDWIHRIQKEQIDHSLLNVSTLELFRLNAFDPIEVREGKELLDELMAFKTPDEPSLEGLKSQLRPYQEIGLRWMWFLYQHSLSGLLCDDMGLGKTHQAMALISAILKKRERRIHFLIVCPTSVIYHWEEKLQEFLPSAKVCTFHGSKRSFKDFRQEYDILLTSYGIWRNENLLLSKVVFEVAIFDEIQAAKNQASRIHSSLLQVKARTRFGLTGTPIENRLLELKALFDIVLPNYMPQQMEYRDFFVTPIEKENNLERRALLSRFIKPFVLRRKKETVLTDLPEKIEEIAHCELALDQKLLYNDVLRRVREGIFRELEATDHPLPYLHIFSALSSLKQICNHPASYLKSPDAYQEYSSGKWDLFMELFWEALESGQKVVIFSQYLAMLDIFQNYLNENKIPFASIRGSTINRKEQIHKFNKDPNCVVFLGSLHAAGLGIDLTAGSVVIHYDRWWNAAREDQATDRVHRIGQKRGVQVFKLVTKGTFEERIDQMIVHKGKLMEEVVGVDDYRFMKSFDREEIMQLFREVV